MPLAGAVFAVCSVPDQKTEACAVLAVVHAPDVGVQVCAAPLLVAVDEWMVVFFVGKGREDGLSDVDVSCDRLTL